MKKIAALFALLYSLTSFATEPTQEELKTLFDPFIQANSDCPTGVSYCFGISLHIIVKDKDTVQTPDWVKSQIEKANTLFSPISVGFYLKDVGALPDTQEQIITRKDRDLLGRKYFSRGVIHVFIVKDLADVDEADKWLNGVHWRDQSNRDKRWVIVASTAWNLTLAHELGHFFGLPHSKYNESIMNKTPREEPAPEDRVFAEKEIPIMKNALKTMVKSKYIVPKK